MSVRMMPVALSTIGQVHRDTENKMGHERACPVFLNSLCIVSSE